MNHSFRGNVRRIGSQPSLIAFPDAVGHGKRQIVEKSQGDGAEVDEALDGFDCQITPGPLCLGETGVVEIPASCQLGEAHGPEMIAEDTQEVLEGHEHALYFETIGIDRDDLRGGQIQIGAHEDVSTVPIDDTNESNQVVDGFPEEVFAVVTNGSGLSVESELCLLEQLREIEDVGQGDLFALVDLFLGAFVVHVCDVVVFGANDQVKPVVTLFINGAFEDFEDRSDRIVGIQDDIAQRADLFGLLDCKMGHASNQRGGLAGKRHSRADLLNSFVQLPLEGHSDGFFKRADEEAYESEMMSTNVVRLSTVFRLLSEGFDSRHPLGFLAHFGGVSDQQSPSINLHNGEQVDTDAGPHTQKV